MINRKLLFCASLLLASLLCSPGKSRWITQAQEEESLSRQGDSITREIATGQTHTHKVSLTGNQFIRVTAQQRGIDVALTILTPNREKILTVDSHPGLQESESASAIAESPGVYFVVIQAHKGASAKGSYTVEIAELRTPSETDRHRAAAEQAFAEAEELRKEARFSPAIEKFYQSIRHWRAAGDVRGEADALSIIGYAHQRLGENLKSLEVSEQALPLSRLAKDKIIEADTLNNIGLAYRWFGEWQKALNYYLEALDIFRQLKDRVRETVTLSNIGVIYRMMGEPEAALTYFFQALEIAQAEKSLPREAAILNHIGVAYAVMGETDARNYEKALERYNRGLEIAKQLGGKERESLALHNIGSAYRNLKRHEDALNSLTQALNLRREAKLIREEPHSLYEIGLVHEAMGRRDQALDYLEQTLNLTGKAGNIPLQATTLAAMARIERDRGDLARSRERIESALNAIEVLRARIANLDMRTSYLSLHRKSYDFYIDLLMRLHEAEPQAGHAAAAFKASEGMRGRTLLDHLTDVQANLRRETEPSLLAVEQDLERKLDAKSAELLKLDAGSAAAKALNNEISALRHDLQQFAGQIKSRNPRYYSLVYQQPSGLAEIQQRALDADTMLLEYALGEERSFLFLVTRDSLRVFALPRRSEIEAAASRFYKTLAARGICQRFEEKSQKLKRIKQADEQLPQAAAELSRMILGPVASELKGKRLLIVGDGDLNLIPFAALPTPAGGKVAQALDARSYSSALLIRKYEIVHLPSASLLAVLRAELKNRPKAPRAVAVFADPVFSAEDDRVKALKSAVQTSSRGKSPAVDQRLGPMTFAQTTKARDAGDCGGGDFERLKFSAAEAQAIARLTARAKRKVLLDFEANQQAAMNEEMGLYRYIHFATHGLLDGHPELSALALSSVDREGKPQDGFLRLIEIFKLKLPAELVVLSACETGLGKSVKGEGVIGMTRGFFTAGAARVMVSLWKVDDESTAQLMAIFYQNLLQRSLSPAAALREAQLKMIEKQPPYHWSGFIVQGEPK